MHLVWTFSNILGYGVWKESFFIFLKERPLWDTPTPPQKKKEEKKETKKEKKEKKEKQRRKRKENDTPKCLAIKDFVRNCSEEMQKK